MMSMVLSNPRLTFYLLLSSAFLLGAILSFIAARYGLAKRTSRMIDLHTENALSERDAKIGELLEDIADLETKNEGYRVRFKSVALFLTKALESAVGSGHE